MYVCMYVCIGARVHSFFGGEEVRLRNRQEDHHSIWRECHCWLVYLLYVYMYGFNFWLIKHS